MIHLNSHRRQAGTNQIADHGREKLIAGAVRLSISAHQPIPQHHKHRTCRPPRHWLPSSPPTSPSHGSMGGLYMPISLPPPLPGQSPSAPPCPLRLPAGPCQLQRGSWVAGTAYVPAAMPSSDQKGVQKRTNRRPQTKQQHNSLRQEATAAAGPAKANKPRPVRLGK